MKRLLLPLLIVLALSACLAPAAQAAIVTELVGGVLTVESDNVGNVNETFTLRDEGSDVIVKVSQGPVEDPDDGGFDCAANTDEVLCSRSAVDSVRINAGNGNDTIEDKRTQGPSILEGNANDDKITTTSGTAAQLRGGKGVDTLTSASADDTSQAGKQPTPSKPSARKRSTAPTTGKRATTPSSAILICRTT